MAPHLTTQELDFVHKLSNKGKAPVQIHEQLTARRTKRGVDTPTVGNLRRVLKGVTYKRGRKETRGRKHAWTKKNAVKVNVIRKQLIKKAGGEKEVTWDKVIRMARVPKVHASTAARALDDAGIPVAWRPPREKPLRTEEHEKERLRISRQLKAKPLRFFTDTLDLSMDNKKWPVPTTLRGRAFLKMTKVRGHLRTRAEGLKPGFTKPNNRKNRINTGSSVNVCAAIINCRIRVWHYLPKKWNAAEAVKLYEGPIKSALRRHRGVKSTYRILEDNDPTGYKSNAARDAKRALGIKPITFPKYSPDLNPLDFFLWAEIERRMNHTRLKRLETVAEYKARLRRTALSIPEEMIREALECIKKRAAQVVVAKGKDIPRD